MRRFQEERLTSGPPRRRGRTRSIARFALAGLTLLVPAAHAFAAGDGRSQSFEERCGSLPPARFEVREVPLAYVLNDGGETIDQLTVKSGNTPATHLTFGLTTVNLGYEADIEITVTEDTATGRVCGSLAVETRLSMQPVTVYLAQELGSSPCARNATLEHELKHVAVFRQVLGDARRDLEADIGTGLGTYVRRAANKAELEGTTNARVKEYLSQFVRRWHRTMEERQALVDSPAEHARVKNACNATG
jgi:hypothetical protein